MLFPELGPSYIDESNRGILSLMQAYYAQSITINQNFWVEASLDARFEAGDQALFSDLYNNMPTSRRRAFNFNRIRRVVSMIHGHQSRNRKSINIIPIENADQQTADQFTKIISWCEQQEGIYETISEAFRGALITGLNLLQVWVDYRSDPVSGNIKVDNTAFNSFLIDPFFRKADLSDCNFIWKRSYLTKRECISLNPDKVDEIIGLQGNAYANRDGKFQYIPETYNYSMNNLLTYDEFYYKDYRTQKILIDTQTGEVQEWKSTDKEALDQFLAMYPQIIADETEIPTVRMAIVIQDRVIYDGPNPLGIDQYPFVPVFGYYRPELPDFTYRLQGVVRGLRDAQYLYNRRRIIELDILESQINSGIITKENTLVNPKDAMMNGQGKTLFVKQNQNIADVVQIQPPQVPPSMMELSKNLANEIQEISGVSDELLGSAQDDKAGILSMLRQGAGLTTLQNLYDNLDYSQRLLGRILIGIIQNNFTPGKIQKIVKEKPAPQFYNKAFGRYDAAVEDGVNTTTQRQNQFAQLLHLKEVGLPIPDTVILKATTVQNKTDIIEAMEQNLQQQQQAQQQQMQLQMQEVQSRIQLANARATADQGLGIERMSRVEENRALAIERNAKAQADHEQALVSMVKAIKELETIDLAHIEKLVTLSNLLKSEELKYQPIDENKTLTPQEGPEPVARGQNLANPAETGQQLLPKGQ